MGVCLGKLHPGGRSVEALPPSLTLLTSSTPPLRSIEDAPPQASSPSAAVAKPNKPNHVAPHPAAAPASLSADTKQALATVSSTKSLGHGSGPPRPLSRSYTATARSGKRATFAVAGSSNGSNAVGFASPAAAAAALLAGTVATATAGDATAALDQATSLMPAPPKTPPAKGRHMSVRPELQRVGSVQRLGDRCRNGKKKAVNVALDVLLKDERARTGFFRYLEGTTSAVTEDTNTNGTDGTAVPSSAKAKLTRRASRLARPTVDYREDCVLFWLEISDLLKIPSGGSFHLGLMHDLFEVYVAKGASRLLPMVSSAEREPLAQYLADRQADRALLSFKMLLLDVLEVVTAAFDEYVRCDSKLGYTHATRNESMHNVLERLVQTNVGAASHDRRAQLYDLLHTPPLGRMFREFLTERNSVENLLFVVDALAFEDLVNAFETEAQQTAVPAHDLTSRHDYCLRQAQKLFNKYIRYGSKAEICLGGAAKARLLQSLVEVPLAAQVFNDAVLLCSAELVQSHLDVFYRSRAFLDYQQARLEAQQQLQQQQYTNKRPGTAPANDATARPTTATATATARPVELDAPTLRDILHGVGVNYFRDFLKDENMESTLLFYKEVEQFQLLPHGQKHYIQIKARRIFDRFVRRGAKLEIELPLDVRRDILFKLSSPSEFTFADALKYVLNVWDATYLPKFRSQPRYKDMRAAMDAAPASTTAPGAALPGVAGMVDPSRRRDSTVAGTGIGGAGSTANPNDRYASGTITSHSGDAVDVHKITLREFLDLECLRKYFRHFLEKEQCLNELHFYFEIATFQQLPTSDYLSRQAKKLYNRFCDPQSRECVVLRDDLKAELHQSLVKPSPAMFRKTQDEIFGFFQSTLFPKFQQSEVYRTIHMTHAQLKNARQSALGALDSDTIGSGSGGNGGGSGGTGGGTGGGSDGTGNGGDATSGSRMKRRSVGGLTAVPELPEEAVSVALILENQDTRSLFLLFAEEIFCTESIYFWLDCNEYKDIPHRNYLKLRAQKIYRKYICGRAKLQVNLESAVVNEIVKSLDDPTRTLFLVAQKSITKMLERDTLPKFRKSKHYQPCLQILRSAMGPTRS